MGNKSIIDKYYDESKMMTRQKQLVGPTPGDPWDVEQHRWNTGAKENQRSNPGGPSNKQNIYGPNQRK